MSPPPILFEELFGTHLMQRPDTMTVSFFISRNLRMTDFNDHCRTFIQMHIAGIGSMNFSVIWKYQFSTATIVPRSVTCLACPVGEKTVPLEKQKIYLTRFVSFHNLDEYD
jgi:hypothetical protein